MRWVCQECACQWRRPAEWRRSGGQRRRKQRECAAEHPSRVRRCCRRVPQSRHGCGPGLGPCIWEPMGSQGRVGGACQPLDDRHDEACMKQKPGRPDRKQPSAHTAALSGLCLRARKCASVQASRLRSTRRVANLGRVRCAELAQRCSRNTSNRGPSVTQTELQRAVGLLAWPLQLHPERPLRLPLCGRPARH